MLSATLDIPAPPGGSMVSLALNPTTAGTLPASVTVAADTLASTFMYTDTTGSGTATITATLGASTSNATVTVTTAAQHLVINEVDYDQIGGDTAEYIEIYNPSSAAISLANVAVVLINGSNNQAYPSTTSSISLASLGSLPAGGYLVLAGTNVTVDAAALSYNPGWTQDAVQNGGSSPDGIALVDTSAGALIDALSYEGSITAAHVPGIANPVSLVEVTVLCAAVADNNDDTGALCRAPNGTDTDSANDDWMLCTTLTPGSANP
jgi:hypothetical protein